MKKLFLFSLVFVLTLSLGYGMAMAGNGAPSGPHYNLNIIGVEKAKNTDMTGSNRHTIFVALKKNGSVSTKIYLTEGEFKVCDGNGFDEAYDCNDNVIGRSNGAVFQLPANGCADEGCDPIVARTYLVYVRALGTPGGSGRITTCVETYDEFGNEVEVCSMDTVVLDSDTRPSKFVDKTKELTTILLPIAIYDKDGNVVGYKLVRYGLFEPEFGQYFWDFNNEGLKLVQLRFYNIVDINKYPTE